MKVIVFEENSFYELTIRIIGEVEKRYSENEWLSELEAKEILGVKSKSKLQELRDSLSIEFSQFGKIIRYSRSSILEFLGKNRRGLDRF